MNISVSVPEGLSLTLNAQLTRKGAVEYHAYVQDRDLRFRGSAFVFDAQAAVDDAVKNLREAAAAIDAGRALRSQFTLDLSVLK